MVNSKKKYGRILHLIILFNYVDNEATFFYPPFSKTVVPLSNFSSWSNRMLAPLFVILRGAQAIPNETHRILCISGSVVDGGCTRRSGPRPFFNITAIDHPAIKGIKHA